MNKHNCSSDIAHFATIFRYFFVFFILSTKKMFNKNRNQFEYLKTGEEKINPILAYLFV